MILSLGMMELYAEIIVEELYDVYEEEKDKLLYRWCGRARAILCFHTRTRLNDRALISICLTMCGWKLAGGWRALKAGEFGCYIPVHLLKKSSFSRRILRRNSRDDLTVWRLK